jgi:5,10-methylenetetrahydromethanopterin reductase
MGSFTTGVLVSPVQPAAATLALARLAEQRGYESVWVADEGLGTRDVFVTMAAIAGVTSTIRIGTGIVNPYNRHPALTAAAIASLDELSGGRAFLALGAGGSLALGPLTIARRHPLARVREAIEVIRELFSGDVVTYEGETLGLRGARITYARPDIEIWFAGRSPLLLAHAGSAADGVLLEFLHKPSLGTFVSQVRSGAERVGRPLPHLLYSTIVVTSPDRLDHIRPHMTYRLVDSSDEVKAHLGITPEHVLAIREAMAGGIHAAAHLIPDEWIEPFVVMGSPEQCAVEIASITRRHGFEGFVLLMADHERAAAEIEVGAEVLARARVLLG